MSLSRHQWPFGPTISVLLHYMWWEVLSSILGGKGLGGGGGTARGSGLIHDLVGLRSKKVPHFSLVIRGMQVFKTT